MFQFNADDRFLIGRRAYPHKGTPKHLGMIVEDCLAGDGIKNPVFSGNTVAFAAAEPDPAL